MTKIKYVEHNGNERIIDVQNGLTVMEGAVQNDIPGIDADCGGGMSCATCHVYFSDEDYARVGAPSDDEMDMLELAFGLTATSRLGCQITIDDNLDGLTVKVPDDN